MGSSSGFCTRVVPPALVARVDQGVMEVVVP